LSVEKALVSTVSAAPPDLRPAAAGDPLLAVEDVEPGVGAEAKLLSKPLWVVARLDVGVAAHDQRRDPRPLAHLGLEGKAHHRDDPRLVGGGGGARAGNAGRGRERNERGEQENAGHQGPARDHDQGLGHLS
jgi:hypothetical protein